MASSSPFTLLSIIMLLLQTLSPAIAARGLFGEYIGAELNGVRFADVPINPDVDFHFILAFAIDYTTASDSPSPTDGRFNVFWDADSLTPAAVASVKRHHPNVKVALSIGGDTVGDGYAYFRPSSVDTWVNNAVASLTTIIKGYSLDGVDVDYEHFDTDPETFAECIGRLIVTLKRSGVISFTSIAPYDDEGVQSHYTALWRKYGRAIDYVDFQFYAYDAGITASQFLRYFEEQRANYSGGKLLASFATDGSGGGLTPEKGFFEACRILERRGELGAIFIWSADDSMRYGFRYEKRSQFLLAGSR